MKRHFSFLLPLLAAVTFSCQSQKAGETISTTDESTQTFSYKDSCQHLVVRLSLEVPMGTDSVSTQIRDSLIEDFIANTQQPGYQSEDEENIKRYSGPKNDVQALVDYYGKADYESLLKWAMSDYNERMEFLQSDTTMSAEERHEIMNDVPQWEYDFAIKKTFDTPTYVVYNSQAYVYSGGAHGGVIGSGALTFNKKSGKRIQRFVKPTAVSALQPMFRKGLLRYYSECGETLTEEQLAERLLLENAPIPLPAITECPNVTGDSLTFTYGQYEIACYADGMPCFAISVKDLIPFLTEEAKALLLKK